MNINIKLDKNFTTQYNRLQEDYGTQIDRLNGFDDGQLSYTDFIDNFIDEDTVANASIDGNSNVRRKDIVTLLTEMPKAHRKVLAFNKIYYEYQKKYGFKAANEWLKREWTGQLYMHDGDTSTFKHYCFSGDTKIMTKEGIKRLDELVGKEVMILNKNHGWEQGAVKNFGRDTLRKLVLERYGIKKEIFVTGNHIWFVKNTKGSPNTIEVVTDELKEGMRIPFNTSKTWSVVEPSPFGVAHGFFTGDGYKSDDRPRANFCGDKTALIPYFSPANITGKDNEFTTYSIPKLFNYLPSINETPSYLYGWLSGYFAADGCVDDSGRCTISSTKIEHLEFVRDVLCVLGMPVNAIRYQDMVSNLTNEMGRIYTMSLSVEYLNDNFFIRPTHIERIRHDVDRKDRSWIVKSVIDTGVEDNVYCVEAYKTQSFTLDNNILTHNCFSYDLKDLAERGLFFLGENFNSKPPKHLVTFVDFVKEYINFASNRSSGAVGLANLIPYMFYFWHKDVENDYMGVRTSHSEKSYAQQGFQRFIYAVNQPCVRDK